MGNNWEVERKKQMVPKYGKSLCFIFPNLGILLERKKGKILRNVTETGNIKMGFFSCWEINRISSPAAVRVPRAGSHPFYDRLKR